MTPDGGDAAATPELLAACWTSAGHVVPFRGITTSPVDVRERIGTVAETGYTGFGLTRQDLVVARDSIGLPAVAASLREHGIATVQLEWITNWWTAGDLRRESDQARADLFDACSVLGVDNIKVGADDDGNTVSYDQLCEGFAALADHGARVGVKIAFENTPFSHHGGGIRSRGHVRQSAGLWGGCVRRSALHQRRPRPRLHRTVGSGAHVDRVPGPAHPGGAEPRPGRCTVLLRRGRPAAHGDATLIAGR